MSNTCYLTLLQSIQLRNECPLCKRDGKFVESSMVRAMCGVELRDRKTADDLMLMLGL